MDFHEAQFILMLHSSHWVSHAFTACSRQTPWEKATVNLDAMHGSFSSASLPLPGTEVPWTGLGRFRQ